jgi:hypothetical protein
MELENFRKYLGKEYTIGRFTIDGKYQCEILEDVVRDLNDYNHDGDFTDEGEGKVYSQTAIPCGRYKVTLAYSMKRKRFVPKLHDVPGFTDILIHSGNSAQDSSGCLLCGENKEKGKVLNSRYHEAVITKAVRAALNRRELVFITIKQ